MALASRGNTLPGTVWRRVSESRVGRWNDSTEDPPRCPGAGRVEKTPAAATHRSRLTELARGGRRRVRAVSSQQQDPDPAAWVTTAPRQLELSSDVPGLF
ncbi:hypothetical protein F2P81_014278 [Scophthalmus maximus]|uniref:Uncharacterized protein n=1 Tax=Scophthalmus maximus TaxID=52904 RepID=A0A6A4SVU9_SCOMX|nr:hypothetical protein F2P81_014278 [Scophthalmus maximus]